MRAHLVQFDISWEQPVENFGRIRAALKAVAIQPGDLIVLPEMCDTGFSLRVEQTADQGHTAAFLAQLANEHQSLVIGGRTVKLDTPRDGKAAENRYTAFDPAGRMLTDYAKVHPFGFGREHERFAGGQQICLFDWVMGEQAIRVAPAVCYDLRFPELFRHAAIAGAELFVLGANWPDARQDHWRALAIARAIECQAFVLAVNRCGSDPHLNYAGGTIAVGPKGDLLGELGDKAGVLSVEIEPGAVRTWRDSFKALDDVRLIGPNAIDLSVTADDGAG